MKNQKKANSTKPVEKKISLEIEKPNGEKVEVVLADLSKTVKDLNYTIVRRDDIEDLIDLVNLMIDGGYEPIGGASFSTKLGFWYQTMRPKA